MSAITAKQPPYPWGLLLLEGLVSLGIGLALVFMPAPTLQLARWLLGLYLISSGVISLGAALSRSSAGRRGWLVVRGVLIALAGLVALSDWVIPGVLISDIALLSVAIVGVFIGFIGLIQAARGAGWGVAVLGLLSIAFGVYVWYSSPALFGYFIIFLGVIVTISGGGAVILAVRMGRRAGTARPIKVRHPLLGMLRVVAILAIMLIGVAASLPAWLIPTRHKGIKLNYWILTYTCRAVNWTLRISVDGVDRQLLQDHCGIIFPNHVSYLDITALLSVEPMRFLSTAEVFRVPFVGWMADSITTIFVDRSSERSRASAREQIAKRVTRDANPAFVIFPEGRFGTEHSLKPFHRGAFEIAAQGSIPYLPCALRYSRPDIAMWRGAKQENFIIAVWRLLTFRGHIRVTVIPLEPVCPVPEDDAVVLAADAQRAIEAALGFPPGETTLKKSGD